MPVQASLTINYEAADEATAQEWVQALDIPDGATVSLHTSQMLLSGTVSDGKVVSADELSARSLQRQQQNTDTAPAPAPAPAPE